MDKLSNMKTCNQEMQRERSEVLKNLQILTNEFEDFKTAHKVMQR